MTDSLSTQVYILIGILVVTAVFWLIGALAAYAGYRAFKQGVDLGWAVAFMVMGLVCLGYAWEAYGWAQRVHLLNNNMQDLQINAISIRLRFAAIEMLAVFAILYLFRSRRQAF